MVSKVILGATAHEVPTAVSQLLALRPIAWSEVNRHPTRREVSMNPLAAVAGFHKRISLPIITPQIHHDAEWALVAYYVDNSLHIDDSA